MPPAGSSGLRNVLVQNRGLMFPLLIVAAILVIIAPLPPLLMDLLLACNVTLAVVILMSAIQVRRPLEFSVFPAVLLGTTLLRLVLNIASTRLILTDGAKGSSAAGGVIEAFGQFVAGGQIAIGLVLFAILVAVQYLVITKGASRISEVAARFALDGLPGKQMAIDADLAAGLITQEEAARRRVELSMQADFYGAMDGASKFVRGDSIAGLMITAINICGGLYIGVFDRGLSLDRAVEVFTTLTIGDGLVSQLPALLISLAAGLLVTRSSVDSHLSLDVVNQTFRHPVALLLAGLFVACLSLTGLPTLPMLILSAGCLLVGYLVWRDSESSSDQEQSQADAGPGSDLPVERPESRLLVHPLELELGVGLLRLADGNHHGDLLERVSRVRLKMAEELGILMPKVRIRDNIHIGRRSYVIKVRGIAVASGECFVGGVLAVETPQVTRPDELPGTVTHEPAHQRRARWIEPAQRQRAEELGFTVVDAATVITTHLSEVVRQHSHEILTRQHVHQLLEHLRQTSPRVVDELVPELMKPSQVQQVLVNLLREQVPIRDLETILETLGHHAESTSDLDRLTESVRVALSRSLCEKYRDSDRVLHAAVIDPELEQLLNDDRTRSASLDGGGELLQSVRSCWTRWSQQAQSPVLLTRSPLRRTVRRLLENEYPRLPVIGLDEISADTQVQIVERLQPQFALSSA